MYRLIALAPAVLITSLLALGCGNAGEDSATTQVTKAQFLKQARAVCTKTKSQLRPKGREWEAAHNGRQLGLDLGAKKVLGPLLKQEAVQLSALTPPEQLEEKVAGMIRRLSRSAVTFVSKGAKGDTAGFKQFQDEAIELGLQACNI